MKFLKNRYLISIVLLFILMCIGYFGLRITHSRDGEEHFYSIETVKLNTYQLSGKIKANKEILLSNPKGVITNIAVKSGDVLTKNQIILNTFDSSSAAKADLVQQSIDKISRNIDAERLNRDILKQEISKSDPTSVEIKNLKLQLYQDENTLKDLEAEYNNNLSELSETKKDIYGSLKSPIEGIATVSDKEVNQTVKITSLTHHVISKISEYDYSNVKSGDAVDIKSLSSGKKLKTHVSFVDTNPLENNRTGMSMYEVRVDVNNNFINGESVVLQFIKPGVKVPINSVKNGFVYLYVNGWAKKRKVVTKKEKGYITVIKGLDEGEQIIVNPDEKLTKDMKVEVHD